MREVSATVEYQPSTEEKLYFALDGERIERLYVAKGDTVKKGQLIAELDMGNLPAEITSQENHIREMELQQSHLAETLELTSSQNTKKEKNAQKKVQEAQQALDDAGDVTAEEKKRLEEALSNAQQELETLEAKTRSDERGIQEQLTSLKEQLEVQREKLEELREEETAAAGVFQHQWNSAVHFECGEQSSQLHKHLCSGGARSTLRLFLC